MKSQMESKDGFLSNDFAWQITAEFPGFQHGHVLLGEPEGRIQHHLREARAGAEYEQQRQEKPAPVRAIDCIYLRNCFHSGNLSFSDENAGSSRFIPWE
jgi:hypothetical protein